MPKGPRSGHAANFAKVLVLPALTFFLVPLLAVGFSAWGSARIDGMILDSVERSIASDRTLDEGGRASARAFFEAHPASTVCDDPDPDLQRFREAVCAPWSETWQFAGAARLARGAALLGLGGFLLIGLLGLVAWRWPRTQHGSFMLGWRLLVAITAVETVVQGVLLVWLSYWGTALLFDRYYPKLILVAAVLAGLAVLAVVRALLRKVPPPDPLEAERVGEADAPGLWRRVRELAARVGTEPPAVIAAGIDDNFFVTEAPMTLGDGSEVRGRALYASLPLLRTLSASEAAAVFGHELAHFAGGDTAASARLYPALERYRVYQATLAEGGLSVPAAHVMRLYRAVFELALKREQRRREFAADAVAARLTSPDDIGRSLLKIAGYSSFRAATENALFSQRGHHEGALAIQARVADGLAAHAASQAFQSHVEALDVPHPFDSHPPLRERLAAAGASVGVADAGELLQAQPADSWAGDVVTGPAIEERLWSAYEGRFKAQHEVSLAWRYLPATDEEREHVLRHFPDLAFPVKKGGEVRLTYRELTTAAGEVALLAEVSQAKIDDGTFSKSLVLTLKGDGKARTLKVDLKSLGDEEKRFTAAFGHYWERDQVARQQNP